MILLIDEDCQTALKHFWVQCTMGSVAEWSKALVLGTSLFGGVGSNPTAAKYFCFFNKKKTDKHFCGYS